MPERVPLYHPEIDQTIERTPKQARALAASGWRPLDTAPDPSEPSEPPQSEHDESTPGDAGDTEETGDGEQEL